MIDVSKDMPWLQRAWQQVQARLADDRLPHALLITGERGVGKRAWAESVAALLLCEQRRTDEAGLPVACGRCKQCDLMSAASHPDLRVYAPEKSRMVKVDQIRALSTFAVASPQVAHHKVAIIDRADQLNINAANALLKTLEEPLPDVTLMLLQESGRPVLPTIRSRCQALTVPVPERSQAERWLVSHLSATEAETPPSVEEVNKALMLSGNAPRLALEYLTGDFLTLRDTAFEAFRSFMKGQIPVAEASKAFKALGLEDALTLLEGWAADLARISVGGQAVDDEAADMMAFLAQRNPSWRAHELLDLVRESRAAGNYNVNPELEVIRILLAWQALMPRRRSAG